MEEELEQAEKPGMDKGLRTILIVFIVWCALTLPCCCFLGYRWQWIMFQLGV